jgi:uncharacterized membrane protein (UPF0127 family)
MPRFAWCALVLCACATAPGIDPAGPPPSLVPATADASNGRPATVPTPGPDAVVPTGFERVAARVTEPDGTVCEPCLWLAESGGQRQRGLMAVTDLGAADGMAFRYPDPHTGAFWMKDTLLPLSIAFYASDGEYLDAFDMEPCTADPCPTYPTPGGFVVAVETNQGGLADLGMVPGSSLELLDLPCD